MNVNTVVPSRLDYCNDPNSRVGNLPLVQNAAAPVSTRTGPELTSHQVQLHWLPVESSIMFTIFLVPFKSLNDEAPTYLKPSLVHTVLEELCSLNSVNTVTLKK